MVKKTLVLLLTIVLLNSSALVWGQEGWEEDFARLCGGLTKATALSTEELKGRVAECDQVLNLIRSEENEKNKVYLFRLKKCRDFYAYMAELKETKP